MDRYRALRDLPARPGSTPDELADVIRRYTPRWSEAIREDNIKAR